MVPIHLKKRKKPHRQNLFKDCSALEISFGNWSLKLGWVSVVLQGGGTIQGSRLLNTIIRSTISQSHIYYIIFL